MGVDPAGLAVPANRSRAGLALARAPAPAIGSRSMRSRRTVHRPGGGSTPAPPPQGREPEDPMTRLSACPPASTPAGRLNHPEPDLETPRDSTRSATALRISDAILTPPLLWRGKPIKDHCAHDAASHAYECECHTAVEARKNEERSGLEREEDQHREERCLRHGDRVALIHDKLMNACLDVSSRSRTRREASICREPDRLMTSTRGEDGNRARIGSDDPRVGLRRSVKAGPPSPDQSPRR